MKIVKRVFLTVILMLSVSFIAPSIINIPIYPTVSEAASAQINKKSATLIKGQTLKLKITGTNKTVKWSTDNKSVATVNNKGKVTSKAKGSAIITAKVGGKKYTCKIKVIKPSISQTSATLAAGKTLKLSISGTSQKATWKSSNPNIVKVNSKGKITAKKKGKATITASVFGKNYKCKVTVSNKFSQSTALNKLSITIKENDYGVFYFIKNNYVYPVGLWGELKFYDKSGAVIGTDYDECYQIEPKDTYVLEFNKPRNSSGDYANYSRYSVNWEVYDHSDSGSTNNGHSKLSYKVSKTSKGITVAVTNNSSEKVYYRANVLFYKNNKLKWNDGWGTYEIKAGKTQYLECDYQYDEDGLIKPDKYDIYIG